MLAARQNGQDAKIKYDKLVIDNKVYRYDDESETSVLVQDNNRQQRGLGARCSLFMGSADYQHHLGHVQSSANQDESESVNGDDEHVNDRAQNEREAMGGARGGDDSDTYEAR